MNKTIIISSARNPQAEYIYHYLKSKNLDVEFLCATEHNYKISLSNDIIINNDKLDKSDLIFYSQFKHDFAPFPEIPLFNDFTVYQDSHLNQEQLNSHLVSLGKIHSLNKGIVVNHPEQTVNFYSVLNGLNVLTANDIPTVDFLCSNFINNQFTHDKYYWMHLDPNSPVKIISKNKIHELFELNKGMPALFFPFEEGYYFRIFFFRQNPILAIQVYNPDINKFHYLENYLYIAPDELMGKLGSELYQTLILDFYEAKLLVNRQNEIKIFNINPDPNIMSLDEQGKEFSLASILNILYPERFRQPEWLLSNYNRITSGFRRMLEMQNELYAAGGN